MELYRAANFGTASLNKRKWIGYFCQGSFPSNYLNVA
jgi:hypothetical protein